MWIDRDRDLYFTKAPGLTVYSTDPDLIFPALMLIWLDGIIDYAPENKKNVLVIPGPGDYTVTELSRDDPEQKSYSIHVVLESELQTFPIDLLGGESLMTLKD